jgi:hypothetical protein
MGRTISRIGQVVCLILLLKANTGLSQPAGYTYGKEITIPSAKIAGTLTNFPVLVSVTDANLKTVGNGGHVQNANGYDIVFTKTDCTTLLNEQIESYSATTGTILIWVRIPSLPVGSNFNFFMFYGNATVAVNPSTTATWDANYVSIWHLDQSPTAAAPQFTDVSSNAQNGTEHNMVAGDQVAGIIGNAVNFDGSTKYISMGGGPPWPKANAVKTFSVWAYYTAIPAGSNANYISFTNSSTTSAYQIGTRSGVFLAWQWGGGALASDAVQPAKNTWHYFVYTWDGTNNVFYVDGTAVQSTTTANQTGTPDEGSFGCYMTTGGGVGGEYFAGYLDEGRISNTNRSANWIKTEYNNQSSPSTFLTFSTEYTASNLCTTLPVKLLYFTGENEGTFNALSWSTATETNNNYFTVERTNGDGTWTTIGTVKGAGNSTHDIDYSLNDEAPLQGVNYYRLKQTDYDGNFTYSDIIAISDQATELKVYPNPVSGLLNIEIPGTVNNGCTVELYNMMGARVYNSLVDTAPLQLNMGNYPAGMYCLVVNNNGTLYRQKVVKQ